MKTTVYITTRFADADDAVMCVKDLVKGTNLEVKAEKVDNDGVPAMYVNVYGDKVAMNGFISAYKDSFANIEDIRDVDPMGWTDPVDLKYYTKDESKQGKKNDDLRDRSISSGTHDSDTLIDRFMNVLRVYARDKYDAYVKENPEVSDYKELDDETKGYIVDELFDLLNEIAPEGTYFGASEGDGADFGFWTVEESCKNESKWYVEYKTIGGDRGKEYFDSIEDAKSYYNDLVDRFHEPDGDGDIEWVEEPVEESCKKNEATFKQGVDSFLTYAPEGGWSDYWAMQQDWEAFKDGLCRDGQITQKQADSWGNPCTPDTFDRWQKRNGLIRRGGWDESKQGKKNEGPGAGYTVTIKDMEISDEPKVEYDEKKGVFTVEANVEYEANAEGYDWSTDYVMHDVIGTDEGTFPYNPYKGVLKLEITNTADVWDSAEGLSTEEKVEDLKSSFYKGASFEDFEGSFGGGWSHSKMDDVVDVYAYTNDYGHVSINFGKDVGIFGSLTIDERFVQNVDFSADFSFNLYELVDAVKEYLEGKGVDMDTISDESLNDVLGSWVTDEITPEYIKEVVTTALSYMDFVDVNGEPVVVESKQSEADYARASKPVADAYKVLDNYYLDNGKLSDFLTEQVLMTYKNDGAMYSRSKSKAVKSHSLAWESLLATINALLEWDDETEHATKLTSEQVKNWFKANGMDYKEALKPLVDAIENQRKEWFGESKQEKCVVIPKVSSDAIHSKSVQTGYYTDNSGLCHIYVDGVEKDIMDFDKAVDAGYSLQESKKSEKLTQKDLKQMATSGAAIDITNVSDEEAKEIRSRKLDTVAISRGTYGMNGALLKDKEGKTYVITARNSNLFYFV